MVGLFHDVHVNEEISQVLESFQDPKVTDCGSIGYLDDFGQPYINRWPATTRKPIRLTQEMSQSIEEAASWVPKAGQTFFWSSHFPTKTL